MNKPFRRSRLNQPQFQFGSQIDSSTQASPLNDNEELRSLNKTTADIIVNKIMNEELIGMQDVRKLVDFKYDTQNAQQSRNYKNITDHCLKARSYDKNQYDQINQIQRDVDNYREDYKRNCAQTVMKVLIKSPKMQQYHIDLKEKLNSLVREEINKIRDQSSKRVRQTLQIQESDQSKNAPDNVLIDQDTSPVEEYLPQSDQKYQVDQQLTRQPPLMVQTQKFNWKKIQRDKVQRGFESTLRRNLQLKQQQIQQEQNMIKPKFQKKNQKCILKSDFQVKLEERTEAIGQLVDRMDDMNTELQSGIKDCELEMYKLENQHETHDQKYVPCEKSLSLLDEMLLLEQELDEQIELPPQLDSKESQANLWKITNKLIIKKTKMQQVMQKLRDHLNIQSRKEANYKKEIDFLKITLDDLNHTVNQQRNELRSNKQMIDQIKNNDQF